MAKSMTKNTTQNETETKTAAVKAEPVVEEVKKPRKFVPGDMITCRCVRPNKVVFYSTKTDTRYEFGGYGDLNEVDYSDLLKLKSSKSPILFQPKILIEDEELREQWKRELAAVSHEYEGIYNTEDLFSKTPDEFDTYLRNASKGIKDIVKITTAKMIKDGDLTDLRKITIVDDVLGTKYKEFL